MKLWKKLTSLLLAAAMMVPFAAAAPSEEGSFSDVDGHWAQAEIEQAVAAGWVDGYPDGRFQPEKSITRAEFTKMLLDAIHLTPGCETVNWMVEHAKIQVKGTGPWGIPNTVDYEPNLNDMDTHWLTTQGWTEAALYSGMVVPSDYNNGNFRPEKPIARYEIALMVTRALGQVYEAKAEEGLDITLPFTDSETTLSWMKGYIRVASEAGVVKGYPDGSFQPNEASTRAEAVVMVQRMTLALASLFELRGVARIDYLYDTATKQLYVNEINTIPGSLSSYLWEWEGVDLTQLLDLIIQDGIQAYRDRGKRISSYSTNLLQEVDLTGGKKR